MSKVIPISPEAVPEKSGDAVIITLRVADLRAIVPTRSRLMAGVPQKNCCSRRAGRAAKVPVSWVYEQSRQGNIPTYRLGRYIRFDLLEVIQSQKKNCP